jgi:hypothetical protein
MADFLTDFRDRLSTVTPKVHPNFVPEGTGLPYIRYQVISDPRPEHLKGYQTARQSRVQVDCFAATYGAARQLAENVIAAVDTPGVYGTTRFGRVKAEGPMDRGEDIDGLGYVHRLHLDLIIEHRPA